MNLRDCKMKVGRDVGYREYCRVWDRRKRNRGLPGKLCYNLFTFGSFLSPAGHLWRPCGMNFPGILLVDWDRGIAHAVSLAALMRMEMLGWLWVPDLRTGDELPFRISRWPDGTHFYLTNVSTGDPLTKPEKFPTYLSAYRAGAAWMKEQKS